MPQADHSPDPHQSIDPHRTWLNQELELIVSGAVIFSLFQVPDLIQQWWILREGQVAGMLNMALFFAYYMSTLITYGLIGAFGGHFLLRGLWVALIGMRAAFPGGIEWSRIDTGPLSREYMESRGYSLSGLEQQVDRLASIVFAFLFVFVAYMLVTIAVFALLYAVAWLIARLVGLVVPVETGGVFVGLLGLYMLCSLAVTLADRLQRRERAPGWLVAFARRMLPALNLLYSGPVIAPITLTFLSNISRKRLLWILMGFVYFMVGLFLFNLMIDRGLIRLDSYLYLPVNAGPAELDPVHYDNLRTAPTSLTPTIGSDIVTGPYLKLFLPFDAREDNERVEILCPELPPQRSSRFVGKRPAESTPESLQAIRDCIDAVYAVLIDDQPAQPDWIFGRHPDFGERGVLAYLPMAEVTEGRHLLTVRHRPLPEGHDDSSADEFYIPFWR